MRNIAGARSNDCSTSTRRVAAYPSATSVARNSSLRSCYSQIEVNNLANLSPTPAFGPAMFSAPAPKQYVLDFGTIIEGGASLISGLTLANVAPQPADSLVGAWDLGDLVGNGFTTAGFDPFNLGAGVGTGLLVTLQDSAIGAFGVTVRLHVRSTRRTPCGFPALSPAADR